MRLARLSSIPLPGSAVCVCMERLQSTEKYSTNSLLFDKSVLLDFSLCLHVCYVVEDLL